MFTNAVNISGSNPVFSHATQANINIYQSSGSQRLPGFEWLLEHVAAGALHNSGETFDAPKCHPGTRVAILDSVFAWAAATFYLIFIQWIYGPAGAGKSAILRSLAAKFEQHGLLLASFFFSRTAAGRNSSDLFIPTIAYQISISIPSTRPHIIHAIESDPLIFSRSVAAQAQALITVPLTQAHKEGSVGTECPRIIIVDGLDECRGEEKQCEVLRVLNDMLPKLPLPFALLIASRPEPHIQDTFNSDLNATSTRLALDDSYKPDEDIRKYYDDKFQEICDRHPLRSHLPKPWPSPAAITTLVKKASGQFIFSATIIRFIEPRRHNPLQRLDMVLGSTSPGKLRPFEALDNLYSTIFASIEQDNLDAILTILGVLLVPLSHKAGVRWLCDLTSLTGYNEMDIRQMLVDLESLLHIVEEGPFVHVHHASLADFLFDQHRSGQFFIDPPMVFEQLARRSITTLIFSGGRLDLDLVADNFEYFLHKSKATRKLIQTLNDCTRAKFDQLNGKETLLIALVAFTHRILPAISSLAHPDAESLHAHLLVVLQAFIASKVNSHFDNKVTPLLVYLVEGSYLHSGRGLDRIKNFDTCFTQLFPVTSDCCPAEVAIKDRQQGFCLTLNLSIQFLLLYYPLSSNHPKSESLTTFILNIVGNRLGDCYADFVTHALKWICESSLLPELEEKVHFVAEKVMPTLLAKSCPRSDVLQLLSNNPMDPILQEIFEYRAAVANYQFVSDRAPPDSFRWLTTGPSEHPT